MIIRFEHIHRLDGETKQLAREWLAYLKEDSQAEIDRATDELKSPIDQLADASKP